MASGSGRGMKTKGDGDLGNPRGLQHRWPTRGACGFVGCLVEWAARAEMGYLVPKVDHLAIGFSPALLFDVLIEILKSCEAVCFFFLPKPG